MSQARDILIHLYIRCFGTSMFQNVTFSQRPMFCYVHVSCPGKGGSSWVCGPCLYIGGPFWVFSPCQWVFVGVTDDISEYSSVKIKELAHTTVRLQLILFSKVTSAFLFRIFGGFLHLLYTYYTDLLPPWRDN
jgi:hypothetical protein